MDNEQISRAELVAAVASLRVVLAAIDAGEIPADLDHVAYLRGAVDTLVMLAGGCLDSKVSGLGPDTEIGETFPQES